MEDKEMADMDTEKGVVETMDPEKGVLENRMAKEESICGNEEETIPEEDPWDLPEINIKTVQWSELSVKGKFYRVLVTFILKPLLLIALLYLFICSLDLLSSAFRLLGGKAAGQVFQQSDIFNNPIAGLMIGVLVTVLVQSSSTSSSIIVTMVGAEVLEVEMAIPMIFGANIGTTVTNTIVALPQAGNKDEFRRAFAGATVHDCFNWLTVIILLPLHSATNFLKLMTDPMVDSIKADENADMDFLKVITNPFTSLIVQIDSSVIEKVAQEVPGYEDLRILKTYCSWDDWVVPCPNTTVSPISTTEGVISTTESFVNVTDTVCTFRNNTVRCEALFSLFDISDEIAGAILLVISLLVLCTCLITIVKLLHSLLKGQIAKWLRKLFSSNFPGKLAFLTGYLSMVVGAGITILVQSSSIFTSAITPLVGIGLITVDRMYPLTLGSNIGTTVTGMLAALTASGEDFANSIQVALVHLFFNIFGIMIWYPIPLMRKVPIRAAKFLGNTTADYRWFAIAYLILLYFLFPLAIFGLSIASLWAVIAVVILIALIAIFVIVVNVMQNRWPHKLPKSMRTWDFLPAPLRSLEPYDRVFRACGLCCSRHCKCCKCCQSEDDVEIASDSEAGGSGITLPTYDEAMKPEGYDNPAMVNDEDFAGPLPPKTDETQLNAFKDENRLSSTAF